MKIVSVLEMIAKAQTATRNARMPVDALAMSLDAAFMHDAATWSEAGAALRRATAPDDVAGEAFAQLCEIKAWIRRAQADRCDDVVAVFEADHLSQDSDRGPFTPGYRKQMAAEVAQLTAVPLARAAAIGKVRS